MGARALAAALLAVSLGCGGAGQRSVDRLDVAMTLRPDGSLEVREVWTVAVAAAARATVTVDLPREHHDGLSDVQPTPDAVVELGRSPSVSWTLEPGAIGPRIFGVRYVAANTLGLGPGRARLAWPVLRSHHRWRIKEAHLVIAIPSGIALVTPGGVAEPGWQVAERANGLEASRANLAPGEPVTVVLEFNRDELKPHESEWQFLEERAQEFAPAFASAAASLLVVGLAVIVLIRVLVSEQARGAARRGLRTAGVVFLVLGPLLALVVRLTLDAFGPWAQSVPAAVAMVGLMFVIAGSRHT